MNYVMPPVMQKVRVEVRKAKKVRAPIRKWFKIVCPCCPKYSPICGSIQSANTRANEHVEYHRRANRAAMNLGYGMTEN